MTVPAWDAVAKPLAALQQAVQPARMLGAVTRFGAICGALCFASPAWASGGITIPEPTDLTLLALALAGLIIGRRGAKRPPKD